MKKSKIALAALAVVGAVGSAFVKANFFNDGSVFCNATCSSRVNYRVEPTGTVTAPCMWTEGLHSTKVQPYIRKGYLSSSCVPTTAAAKFTSVSNAGR